MNRALHLLFFIVLPMATCHAQDEPTWFDFWVGDWEVSWDEQGGKVGRGKNRVVKILGNSVIQENFEVAEGSSKGYLGTSISVYNPRTKVWHQGYVDNQGAYINLIGDRQGERRIFQTLPEERDGKTIVRRMVFYDITSGSFSWDWESSEDGGETWKLNWRIRYTRMKG